MIRYVFRDEPVTLAKGADPQRIGEALADIKKNTKGKCNARVFLDAASNKKNYLHSLLEWDDQIAGDKYRLDQMREIVSSIDIVDKSNKKFPQAPAFISITEREGRGYRTTGEVLNSSSLQAILLRQLEREMEHMERRLLAYADIANAVKAARKLIAERAARYASDGAHPMHS